MLLSDEEKEAVAEFVTRGNVAQLSDGAFRSELVSCIRFNPADAMKKRDGLAGRTMGQPAVPGWLARTILPLVLTPKGQAATDAANIRTSSGVAVFVSSEQGREAWIEAGRLTSDSPCRRLRLVYAPPSSISQSRCRRYDWSLNRGSSWMANTRNSWSVLAMAPRRLLVCAALLMM